ncbi:Proteasome B-type subunit [Ostreococcus tauri]|uniref:Proteasome subunit beta n=1 Tax=Ostreococcus tauri TaxID=70448 RepID=Q018W2_OSTTA|nr:Proteasome B-type subunit [Ostreococcus tauri]OUS47913.1 beta 7 subunit of 20S proteasome [Ostreococcus tauri]CAL54063.1 Proteasome B-type subunit [Ostreococcus tauri]|eukprot:XP_003079405.1 Proteasome B-type subunit [Ostreococcus tauri]
MIPRRTAHERVIGPGVVPHGVDPEHDALYRGRTARGTVTDEVLRGVRGRPFTIDGKAREKAPATRTQTPYVTGTSALGLKYAGGVLLATDTLACYGSTKRYKSVERVKRVNDKCAIAFTGELSDFAYVCDLLEELTTEDFCEDDGTTRDAEEIYQYLTRVMYNRRSKFDPLWNSFVVAGYDAKGEAFCGTVGMIGTHYADDHVAAGFGNHIARPIFREFYKPDLTEEEAVEIMKSALYACVMRDKQMMNKFQIAKVTKEGVSIGEPFAVPTEWGYEKFYNPTKFSPGGW